ncbi:MAG: hypothetical protein V3U28_06070 [Candidatus Acidoferrales bacterium]
MRNPIAAFCAILLIHPAGAVQTPDTTSDTRTTFRVVAPFWKTNQGFSSTLIIRNRHKKSPATVTPILYTADGREVRLETLELAPNSVQELPLAEALAAASEWARSGAVALEFQAPNAAAVAGYALVMDERRSLLFNSVFRVGYAGGGSKTFFAPWWLRDEGTRGTLVLFNASEEQLTVHPSVAVGLIEYSVDEITLTPHQVKEIDLRTLLRENGLPGADRGLLRLGYDGPKQALFPALLLFNEKTGHSLAVNFAASQEPNEDPANAVYFPAVLVNHPDPVLGFKSSLEFTPHALLGNTTSEFLSVELKATFELPGASEVKSVTLPITPLAPLETRLVDFSTYIAQGIIPEEISQVSLRLSYQGAGSDLAAHVFTMDRSGDFTFSMAGLISVAPPAMTPFPGTWQATDNRRCTSKISARKKCRRASR